VCTGIKKIYPTEGCSLDATYVLHINTYNLLKTIDIEHLSYLSNTIELQRQNAENFKQIFPEKECRGLSPNFHIHVSESELYIPTMGLPVLLEEICRLILGIYKSLKDTRMWKLGLRPRYSQKRNI
jgi:hypothetical protein